MDLLREAVALQRCGAIAEAAARYRKVLLADPDNADAYFYLGMMSCQAGQFNEGAEFARKALARDAYHANAYVLLGRALNALGLHDEAIKSLQQAIALTPDLAPAHSHLADILSDLGRDVEAIHSYDNALALAPDCVEDWFNRGIALNIIGQTEEALESFERVIGAKPDFARAHLERGNVLWRLRRFDEALESIDKAFARDSSLAEAWHSRGNILYDLGQYDGALAAYDKTLAVKPDLAEAWLGRGNGLGACQQYEEALVSYEKALSRKPELAAAWLGRGNALFQLKRHEEASAAFDRALLLKSDLPAAWHGRGKVLYELRRFDEAFAAYDKTLALDSDLAEAWLGRGNVHYELKRFNEAFVAYDEALALDTNLAGAWLGSGNVHCELKRFDEAFAAYDEALALDSNLAEAWHGRGNVLHELRRFDDALAAYDRALTLKAELAETWLGRGNTFKALRRFPEALAAFDRAAALKPDLAEAWIGRGDMLAQTKRHDEAVEACAQVLNIDPQRPFMKGALLHQKMSSCDWDGADALFVEIESDVSSGKLSADPFGWQGLASSALSLQRCAQLFNAERYPAKIKGVPRQVESNRNTIRVGYVSGEFREQATSHLIVGVLEQHDKSRFEIFGFDNGWDDKSEIRRRIEASCLEIIDINRLSDEAAAAIIRDRNIDILVNLNGYFGEERTGVFAQRAAPVQVNYLGFPGTLGASYMDYIIADQCVIPPGHEEFYDEKVIYLPECYQANDNRKGIGPRIFDRAECGLTQHGFVYCCFNNSYKITREVFDCWMRILREVPDSALWLIEDSTSAVSNLKREASIRKVDPDRLVFAPRIPLSDHLARHRLADLFLDTLPYNAHTTASDALWAGLPVLTQLGGTFPGRVAASLLQAIGLPELIASTREEYQQLAIELASDAHKLTALKHRLAINRLGKSLFDTQLFTRRLEAAYEEIYKRHRSGLARDHISIANHRDP
jgi:protein O-GlcNAc transferase